MGKKDKGNDLQPPSLFDNMDLFAAATPEDDLIVLRTDGARYQLDLGAANFSIDFDSNVSGSVS